jgi:ABC-type antimicrobial peptide transport system permease subunit
VTLVKDDTSAPVARPVARVARSAGGSRLLRFALANIRRRPERFALSTLGIALAVMAVIVVRTIAAGYASSGSAALEQTLRGDPLWVVGQAGFRYDAALGALLPNGAAPALRAPAGWTAHRTVGGIWHSGHGDVAVFGRDDVPAGSARVGRAAARLLDLRDGSRLSLAGTSLSVTVVGGTKTLTVPESTARTAIGDHGWWTLSPSAQDSARLDLGTELAAATGIPSTTDPAQSPAADSRGLIFDTVGAGGGATTFGQRFAALFTGKVAGSALGIVSTVGLVLGFVIAVSSFLAAVQERRREFGIMSSIGLADEVLYFFLVESALVFLVAYLVGALAAGAAVALVVPGLSSLAGWLTAAGTVAAYLPAMAIVGALIPVHRLLQQRPVELLRDDA